MEDLAYRRLLDQYYLREAPLPTDVQATAKLIRMRSFAGDVESVLREFFELTDGGWRHTRCDTEIDRMQDKQAKARASAAASVAARKANGQRPFDKQQTNAKRPVPEYQADVELPTPTPTPKEKTNTGAAALTVLALIADGLTEQTAGEFLALRKSKGARLTARAWQGVVAEAQKAGWTVEQAVCKSLARGWTGFEAAWVREDRGRNGAGAATPDEPEWRREQRERNEAFLGPYAAKRTANVIDMEAPNAAPVRVA